MCFHALHENMGTGFSHIAMAIGFSCLVWKHEMGTKGDVAIGFSCLVWKHEMGTKGDVKTQNLGTIKVDPPKWEFSLGTAFCLWSKIY